MIDSKTPSNHSLFSSIDFTIMPSSSHDKNTYFFPRYLHMNPPKRKLSLMDCTLAVSEILPTKQFSNHFEDFTLIVKRVIFWSSLGNNLTLTVNNMCKRTLLNLFAPNFSSYFSLRFRIHVVLWNSFLQYLGMLTLSSKFLSILNPLFFPRHVCPLPLET